MALHDNCMEGGEMRLFTFFLFAFAFAGCSKEEVQECTGSPCLSAAASQLRAEHDARLARAHVLKDENSWLSKGCDDVDGSSFVSNARLSKRWIAMPFQRTCANPNDHDCAHCRTL